MRMRASDGCNDTGLIEEDGDVVSDRKQSSSKKIAWLLAIIAIGWYLVSMFTIWK